MEFLLNYFKNNKFPLNLVFTHLKNFLDKLYHPKSPIITVPKKQIYFKLPYFGYLSERIKHDLQKLLDKNFPHLNLHLCFVNSFQIGSFFSIIKTD